MEVLLTRTRATHPGRPVRVRIAVRAAYERTRVLYELEAHGERAEALALVDAVAFCGREGHTPVAPTATVRRLVLPDDGTEWWLADAWLATRSSGAVIAQVHAVRAAVQRAAQQARTDAAG